MRLASVLPDYSYEQMRYVIRDRDNKEIPCKGAHTNKGAPRNNLFDLIDPQNQSGLSDRRVGIDYPPTSSD